MKQNLALQDLLDLNQDQKLKLRSIWIPKERDLAVAIICSNDEENTFDHIIFTIGKIEYNEFEGGKNSKNRQKYINIVLRSLKLVDEIDEDEEDEDDELIFEYEEPDDYFALTECLPLLSIGQMLEILNKHYYKGQSFNIDFNGQEKLYKMNLSSYDSDSYQTSHEFCDLLWELVKSML